MMKAKRFKCSNQMQILRWIMIWIMLSKKV